MQRWRHDERTGLPTIQRSPEAASYPTPEAVQHWAKTGTGPASEPTVEPLRCPTCGRASDCCCPDCPYCVGGVPQQREVAQHNVDQIFDPLLEALGRRPAIGQSLNSEPIDDF